MPVAAFRPQPFLRMGLAVVGALSVTAAAAQQDIITLQPEGGSSRIRLKGLIVDYTGTKITVQLRQGQAVHEYPAGEVVAVETAYHDDHLEGLKLFAEGRLDKAREKFESALKYENRTWVRRELLAELVRVALAYGDYSTAAQRFVPIVQSDPETIYFHLIPLMWVEPELDEGWRALARSWLRRSGVVERLLGASILLMDPELGQAAASALDDLASELHPGVRVLAKAQLWRLRLREGDITLAELRRWQKRLDAMPDKLRGGPSYVLGRAQLQHQQFETAAATLLWLPLVYDEDRLLASRAAFEAGRALQRIGQVGKAKTLYREIVTRFSQTSFAQDASAALEALESAGS